MATILGSDVLASQADGRGHPHHCPAFVHQYAVLRRSAALLALPRVFPAWTDPTAAKLHHLALCGPVGRHDLLTQRLHRTLCHSRQGETCLPTGRRLVALLLVCESRKIDWTDFIQCGALKEALRCYLCQLQPQELAELFIQEIRKPVTLLFRHTPTESDEDLYGWLPPECLRHYLLLRVTRQDGRVVLANRVWHRDEPTVEAWLDRNRLWIFQQVEHDVERDSLSERLPDPKQYSRMEFDENAVVNEPWSFDPGYLDGDELPLIFDD